MARNKQTNKPMVARKSTTVWVRPDLWRQVKIRAAQVGLKVSEVADQAFEKWLKAA